MFCIARAPSWQGLSSELSKKLLYDRCRNYPGLGQHAMCKITQGLILLGSAKKSVLGLGRQLEDLSSTPSTHLKKPGLVGILVIPALGKWRQEAIRDLLARQSVSSENPRCQREIFPKKPRLAPEVGHPRLTSGLCAQVLIYSCTYTCSKSASPVPRLPHPSPGTSLCGPHMQLGELHLDAPLR